jgi:D-3-phosphoglycerate dehydrogenase
LEADIYCGHAKVPIDWERVTQLRRLKWIQSSAAGLDHCLTPAIVDSNILVSGASGLFADQVAEQTMALLYGLIRKLPVFFRGQQAKQYLRHPTDDLHGKVVGIVGFGCNGQRIAELLKPIAGRIIATDYFPDDCPDSIDQVLPAEQTCR